jgi:hypothetical protein
VTCDTPHSTTPTFCPSIDVSFDDSLVAVGHASGLVTTWSLASLIPPPPPSATLVTYSLVMTTAGAAAAAAAADAAAVTAAAAAAAEAAGAPHGLSVRLSGLNYSHTSHVTRHTSHVTRHRHRCQWPCDPQQLVRPPLRRATPHVLKASHTSHVTRHTSHVPPLTSSPALAPPPSPRSPPPSTLERSVVLSCGGRAAVCLPSLCFL